MVFLTAGLVMVLRQRAQTMTVVGLPLTVSLVESKFAPKVRLVRRLEWLTLFPVDWVLLQM